MTTTPTDADLGVDLPDPADRPQRAEPAAEPNRTPAVQALLFHPNLAPNVKILLLQLLWLGSEVTADDLSKGSMLTPLQVQYALRDVTDLGLVTTRFVLVDEATGKTVRKFRHGEDFQTKLGTVPAPDKRDTSVPAEADE